MNDVQTSDRALLRLDRIGDLIELCEKPEGGQRAFLWHGNRIDGVWHSSTGATMLKDEAGRFQVQR